MENDQFGGRTDDDLFADDYESVPVEEQTPTITPAGPPTQTQQHNAPAPTLDANTTHAPVESEVHVPTPPPQKQRSLAQSRHARPEKGPRPNNNSNHTNNSSQNANNKPHGKPKPAPSTATAATTADASTAPEQDGASGTAPSTAPKAPSSTTSKYVSTNTASVVSEARLGSGANPRTKPSEAELAEKMDRMRIVNAEQTRRFEQAQKDETAHAAVMARSAEEQKKRRAEEAVKRRAAEEDKRRLEEVRAKNRQRKLNAMSQKEGGWDEGKEERMREEENGRSFRGAHGGVRGARTGGLGGSRFADDNTEGERLGDRGVFGGTGRGRGRGRGGRGERGRGGRELFDADGDRGQGRHGGQLDTDNWGSLRDKQKQAKAAAPKPEEFPALPSAKDKAPKPVDTTVAAVGLGKLPELDSPFSPLGRWDEEVNAADAKSSS